MASLQSTHESTSSSDMLYRSKKFIGAVEDEWQLFSDCASDYIIGSPIGFGASSIVYTATYQPRSTTVQPPVSCALKVLDLDALPPRSLSLLQRETTLMSLSKHPNVLRVRGSWVDGHKLYIALRLMNKGSAADIMRYGWPGGMEEDVVRCILRQALQGLNYLHINGFIHRDIKAANLLIDDDGTVLLGDLGVAADLSEDTSRLLHSSRPSTLISHASGDGTGVSERIVFGNTVAGIERPKIGKRKSFVGTPCWMAPELIQGRQYDSSADIWSFGITALELTQGRPPRSRESSQQVLLKTIQDDPPTLDREGGAYKYSRAFKEVVESCLVKDPSKRPTAEELLQSPFFKASKKKSYLVGAILKDLPPLTQRQERRTVHHPQTLLSVDSWDFPTALNSATTSISRRRILEDVELADHKTEGVTDDREKHLKGISWADKPGYATIDYNPASSTSSGSSPSSLVSEFPNSQEMALKFTTRDDFTAHVLMAPSSLSPHVPLTVESASPSTSVLSSTDQQSLWHKIKSNIRRQSFRSDPLNEGQKGAILPLDTRGTGISGRLSGTGRHSRPKANGHPPQIVGEINQSYI